MSKKFIIKDEDGSTYEVTETSDEETVEPSAPEEIHDDEGLTSEEIALLKKLAAHADEIIASFSKTTDEEPEVLEDDGEDLEAGEVVDEDPDEEVLDTKSTDSKKSFGSLEKRKAKDSISLDDKEQEIAKAWADRFAQVRNNKGE